MAESGNWMLWTASLALAGFVSLLILGSGKAWLWWAQKYVADLTPRLEELNVPLERLPRYLTLWGLAMLGIAVLGLILGMIPVALVTLYLLYVAPRLIINALISRRQTLLRNQMVNACVNLANTAKAGLSLPQGLAVVAKESPQPLQDELKRIVHQYNAARPLPAVITEAKNRLKLHSFTLFANTILISLERGGRITDALENISKSLEENERLERKISADTASGRRIVVTLAVFPFVYLLLFLFLDYDNTSLLFTQLVGQLTLVAVAVIVYISVRWSNRFLNIEL